MGSFGNEVPLYLENTLEIWCALFGSSRPPAPRPLPPQISWHSRSVCLFVASIFDCTPLVAGLWCSLLLSLSAIFLSCVDVSLNCVVSVLFPLLCSLGILLMYLTGFADSSMILMLTRGLMLLILSFKICVFCHWYLLVFEVSCFLVPWNVVVHPVEFALVVSLAFLVLHLPLKVVKGAL